jgi:TetR/AcrR family transcriptional regulator, transcriptional repressor for nem operon
LTVRLVGGIGPKRIAMGRTSDARERLILAMLELIWVGSFGTTSVDQICERAEVKKGSFYHFFESKHALAIAAIEHGWTEFREKLDRCFSAAKSPMDRIMDCMDDLFAEQLEMRARHGRVLGCPIHTLGTEVSPLDQEFQAVLKAKLGQYVRYFESAIRDAHAEGLIVAPDAEAKAKIVFAYSEGLLAHARIWNDLAILESLKSGVRDILRIEE